MTFDVKTYNVIAQEGIDVFPKDSYTVNKTEKPDALLIRSQDMHKTAFGTNVLAIARAGAGFNNIPLENARIRAPSYSIPRAQMPMPSRNLSLRF